MKRAILFLITVGIIFSFTMNVFAEKAGYEYGGSQIYLENKTYDDGYGNDGKSLKGSNHFSATRLYLTNYYYFSDNTLVRLTLDSTGQKMGNNGVDYENSWIFVKYLYVEFKNLGWADSLYIGQIANPWTNWEDKIWGYRIIAKSLLDDTGITQSTDRGMSWLKKIDKKSECQFALVGGEGYKQPDYNRDINFEGRYTYEVVDNIKMSVGTGAGTKANNTALPSSTADWADKNSVSYLVGNIHYKTKDTIVSLTSAGYVVDNDSQRNGTITKSVGNSITGVQKLIDNLNLIGRLDNYDPDKSLPENNVQKSIIGLGYKVNEDLQLVVNKQASIYDRTNTVVHINYFQAEVLF
ncbi:MAG: hypothetical protein KKA19_06040 [Candidatus Margulisbacteria bacterium]|nr:hypothetical protein [Candidatus Margulisiibacteriota bacterium]